MIPFRGPDGTWWGTEVCMPSHSSALVIFHHPTGETARLNRYVSVNVRDMKAQDPRQCLTKETVTKALSSREIARLFRRSVPVSSDRPSYIDS